MANVCDLFMHEIGERVGYVRERNVGGQLRLRRSSRGIIGDAVQESTGRAVTYLVTQIVTFGGSVMRLQGVALLHKNLPVNSQFGAIGSSLSTS